MKTIEYFKINPFAFTLVKDKILIQNKLIENNQNFSQHSRELTSPGFGKLFL